ncbi:MAG TPA: putative glycolipid-binding domain-containing protein [Actinomycetota bacterium]
MPAGAYTILHEGHVVGREAFRCAPGPAGWRWFSEIETSLPEPHREIVDYTVDTAWRPVRLRVDTGSHRIELTSDQGRLRGRRDGQPLDLALPEDLDYLSPCFNAVTANRLGGSARIRPLYMDPVTIQPRVVDQTYDHLGEEGIDTPVGRFPATAWRYTAPATGFTARLWVAGDIVVSYEGVFELAEYEPGPAGPVPLT